MHTQHTPGPWKLAEKVEGKGATPNQRRIRSDAPNAGTEYGAVCQVEGFAEGSESCANGRLIAAAPELLDALVLCEGNISSLLAAAHPKVYGEWLTVVRAAINKAIGEKA